MTIRTAFYAYPSQPREVLEAIEAAAAKVTRPKVRLWRLPPTSGTVVIKQITDAINKTDMFACDLTYPNPNVLFELGYAVARRKRVFISLNVTMEQARENFETLQPILSPSVSYTPYSNSTELSQTFQGIRSALESQDDLLGSGFKMSPSKPPGLAMLYIKQPLSTESSVNLSEALASSAFSGGLIPDNPSDNPVNTLGWYAEKIRDSDAVLVHLLSENHTGNYLHNLKCAFVAGMARGLERPILMLAPEPYRPPVDYRELLRVHHTSEECVQLARAWVAAVAERLPRRRRSGRQPASGAAPEFDLRSLHVGDHVAEFEQNSLLDYFVEPSWFTDILRREQTILVGRRGSGKTATLYALANHLRQSRSNHVCTIQPLGYEVDGIIRLLSQSIDRYERGYLIESLWKFLVYTELVNSVVDEFHSRAPHEQEQMKWERELLEFWERQEEILKEPFSIRLEKVVTPLQDLHSKSSTEQLARISELLHVNALTELRILLGRSLSPKKTVAIFIDNLDEPWTPQHDKSYLAQLLIGLLGVSTDISASFRRKDSRYAPVNLKFAIFIRSDIFYQLRTLATEGDKLPVLFASWSDRELLMRLVDERLCNSLLWNFSAEDIWTRLFTPSIMDVSAREFIAQWSIGRPRDVIFFTRQAVANAVNRGHEVVAEGDLMSARKSYSYFAFNAILAEDDPHKGKLKDILYGFVRKGPRLPSSEIADVIRATGASEVDVDFYVDLLCDMNFLGIESGGEVILVQNEVERAMVRRIARQAAVQDYGPEGEETYRVNRAFYDVLQIR